jgi:hypothetical protein
MSCVEEISRNSQIGSPRLKRLKREVFEGRTKKEGMKRKEQRLPSSVTMSSSLSPRTSKTRG